MTSRNTASTKPVDAPVESVPVVNTTPEVTAPAVVFTEEEAVPVTRARKANPYVDPMRDLIKAGKVGTNKGFGFIVPKGDNLATVRHHLDAASKLITEEDKTPITARTPNNTTLPNGDTKVVVVLIPRIARNTSNASD